MGKDELIAILQNAFREYEDFYGRRPTDIYFKKEVEGVYDWLKEKHHESGVIMIDGHLICTNSLTYYSFEIGSRLNINENTKLILKSKQKDRYGKLVMDGSFVILCRGGSIREFVLVDILGTSIKINGEIQDVKSLFD